MARGRLIKVTFRLDGELYSALKRKAQIEDRPTVILLEEAVSEFLSDEHEQTAAEGTFRLASKIEGRVKGVRTDMEALTDLFCFFIFHWFCHTPALPGSLRPEAAANGMVRYNKFIDMLKGKREAGESFARLFLSNPTIKQEESANEESINKVI